MDWSEIGQRFDSSFSQNLFNLFKWGIEPKGEQQQQEQEEEEEEEQQLTQFLGLWQTKMNGGKVSSDVRLLKPQISKGSEDGIAQR